MYLLRKVTKDDKDPVALAAIERYLRWARARRDECATQGLQLGMHSLDRIILKIERGEGVSVPKMFWTGILE